MALSYEELHKKTIGELREIAQGLTHDAVQGYSQMNKEHLLPALCEALGIEAHAHHHLAAGFDKSAIKARMKALRADREKALEARDNDKLQAVRRELHRLNHRIRAHTV